MNIISWNVAGLRARLKNNETHNNSLMTALFNQISSNSIDYKYFDIVCLQETKCNETDVKLPCEITNRYPYRFWNSSKGTTQRKGFSGTTIWCTRPPIKSEIPDFDEEGRIIMVEFDEFILVNVYVPNSQTLESGRYYFRQEWDKKFFEYINNIKKTKEVIICGDFNVAHLDIDITNPKQKKNKVAGFYDSERRDFAYLLELSDLIDVFRTIYPKKQRSTYWSNFMKDTRKKDNGWRIDYFLMSQNLFDKKCVDMIDIQMDVSGSDHCPINLIFNDKKITTPIILE